MVVDLAVSLKWAGPPNRNSKSVARCVAAKQTKHISIPSHSQNVPAEMASQISDRSMQITTTQHVTYDKLAAFRERSSRAMCLLEDGDKIG